MAAPIEITVEIDAATVMWLVNRLVGRDDCPTANELQRMAAENDRLRTQVAAANDERADVTASFNQMSTTYGRMLTEKNREIAAMHAAIRAVQAGAVRLDGNVVGGHGWAISAAAHDALLAFLPPDPAAADAGEGA